MENKKAQKCRTLDFSVKKELEIIKFVLKKNKSKK
jgi:hypothetical protein